MNAYELADELQELDAKLHLIVLFKSAEMLRQQADLIRNLQKSLGFKNSGYETINLTPQTKPLSDEEIMDIAEQSDYSPLEIEMGYDYEIRIARAIEERHGIK